ncbi:hypothetical protein [Ramlibacter sp. AN1133]|uniref:hypothetical protein n=1 Tax=Ramlibacter sp. AN1133 TaxID=3133429 RepID=UPI0030C04CF0
MDFAFDIVVRGAIRVEASNEAVARAQLECSDGERLSGTLPVDEPVVIEASLASDVGTPALFERDGEAAPRSADEHTAPTRADRQRS